MMLKSILLTVDLNSNDGWQRPTSFAVKMAQTFGAELHVMTVVPDFGMSIVGSYFDKSYEQRVLSDMQAKLDQFVSDNTPSDVSAKSYLAHGSIYDQIMTTADKLSCDGIVIGAHRPELKDYLLGPNAARVVRHAKQSVFVIRD